MNKRRELLASSSSWNVHVYNI